MSKETYYFSHDANARNDEKILMLRAEHGMEGYGIYWALLEMMFESSDTKLSHDKVKGMAVGYNVAITVLKDVIKTAISEGLFVSDDEKFWSESLLRRKGKYLDLKKKKSEAGKKGMAKRWSNKDSDNTVITDDNASNNGDITENNKGKERKGKETKEKIPYTDIVNHLNEKAGKKFKPSANKTKDLIQARWNEGNKLEDFYAVIDHCTEKWSGQIFSNGQKGDDYLQPSTLFNGKFDERLNWTLNKEVDKNNGENRTPDQIEHDKLMEEMGYQ